MMSDTVNNSLEAYIKNHLGQKTIVEKKTIIFVQSENRDREMELRIMTQFPEFSWDFIDLERGDPDGKV